MCVTCYLINLGQHGQVKAQNHRKITFFILRYWCQSIKWKQRWLKHKWSWLLADSVWGSSVAPVFMTTFPAFPLTEYLADTAFLSSFCGRDIRYPSHPQCVRCVQISYWSIGVFLFKIQQLFSLCSSMTFTIPPWLCVSTVGMCKMTVVTKMPPQLCCINNLSLLWNRSSVLWNHVFIWFRWLCNSETSSVYTAPKLT